MENITASFKTHKKPIVIIAIVIFALSIPIIVAQVLKNQDTRQHASTAPAVTLAFTPSSKQLNINETFDVALPINTNTNDLSAIDGYLQYNHDLFTLTGVTAGTDYTQVPMPTTAVPTGTSSNTTVQEYVFVNKTVNPKIGAAIIPAVFHFTAKAAGTGTISFGSLPPTQTQTLKIAAASFSTNVLSNSPGAIGTYTVISQSASPTVTNTLSPTVSPTITSTLAPTITSQHISCTNETNTITFNMKSPYSAVADSPISGITLTSGNWCAWSSSDTANYSKCPVKCPELNPASGSTTTTPITLSQDKLSLSSNFDTQYADNSGSCTYAVTCSNTNITITPSHTPTPTNTPTPTPTSAPNETRLNLSLSLPGIGHASGNNANPARQTRKTFIQVFDSTTNKLIDSFDGTLTYESATGVYKGAISLGTNFVTGNYYVKARFDNTLWKRTSGNIQITKGSAQNTAQPATLVSGDVDGNNKLTIDDYNAAVACFQKTAACTEQTAVLTDNNDNGTNDLLDYVILRAGFATISGD